MLLRIRQRHSASSRCLSSRNNFSEGRLFSNSRRFSRARTRCDGLQYNCGRSRRLMSKGGRQCLHLRVRVVICGNDCVTGNYIRNEKIPNNRILKRLRASGICAAARLITPRWVTRPGRPRLHARSPWMRCEHLYQRDHRWSSPANQAFACLHGDAVLLTGSRRAPELSRRPSRRDA